MEVVFTDGNKCAIDNRSLQVEVPFNLIQRARSTVKSGRESLENDQDGFLWRNSKGEYSLTELSEQRSVVKE